MPTNRFTNQLAKESSPYLLQHAHNPVEWYPWNETALNKAREENKPILLSIGYAACHWCHVMAHESFEDEETAKVMNQHFINIKVDREERPDLDKVYQTAHQILTQQAGGWPLTVFLTPHDLTPFFSGTYFPPQAQYGLPGFKQILQGISDIYKNHAEEIQKQNVELNKLLNQQPPTISDVHLNDQPVQHALRHLENSFDKTWGGFNGAPKFPQPSRLEFLLHTNPEMVLFTLKHMALGGIYDQLGGGFFRYSVDAQWMIPHFEKMLYDNAQLLYLYALVNQYQPDDLFCHVVRETAQWLVNRMQAAEGGYYSSIDADSEGKEGKYYVWYKQELREDLNPEEYAVVDLYFGLHLEPNFETHYHLCCVKPIDQVANELDIALPIAEKRLTSAKQKLLTLRKQRIEPHLDTKILTAWNALAIKAMLVAGNLLNDDFYIDSAFRSLTYLLKNLWRDNRLMATTHLPAYLDDYAYLIDALLTSIQYRWNTEHLNLAIQLAERVLTDFYDQQSGGFYFTANDHEKLLYRPKTMMDDVIPAGNAIIAKTFFLLGYLLGETRYLTAAEKTLHAAWPSLTAYPAQHCAMLLSLMEYLTPPKIIIIRGEDPELTSWNIKYQALDHYVFAIPNHEVALPAALKDKMPRQKICAYICEGMKCSEIIE